MALEASDLNDGTILQATTQARDERGNIQFSVQLPSGRTLKSEFIPADKGREALKTWLEVVKQQAVADAKAEQEERRAKARRAQTDLERQEGDDKPLFRAGGGRKSIDDVPMDEWTEASAKTATKRPDESIQASDPLEYARQQYNYYSKLLQELKPKVAQYEKFVQQWGVILESLEKPEQVYPFP